MKYAKDMQLQDEKPGAGFDAMMTRALERREEVAVPLAFAARVVAALPAPQKARAPMLAGRRTALVAAGVLAVAMFALAPHVAPTFASLAFDFELVAILQLAGIGYWVTARRDA